MRLGAIGAAAILMLLAACASISPAPTPPPAPRRVPSPDYGLHVFVWGHVDTTDRDRKLATDAGIRWQKSLFPWRLIERAGKGQFDWTEADRVVKASTAAGLKIVARLAPGSANGTVNAVEVWNEPNLDRDWGEQPISAQSAAEYVRLLSGAYQAAHRANPNIIVLS